jgi:hypothetical protein
MAELEHSAALASANENPNAPMIHAFLILLSFWK